jgi:hypothetical protein
LAATRTNVLAAIFVQQAAEARVDANESELNPDQSRG